MTAHNLNAIDTLLDAWLNHENLRKSGAPLGDLASSRWRLDSLRLQTRAQSR